MARENEIKDKLGTLLFFGLNQSQLAFIPSGLTLSELRAVLARFIRPAPSSRAKSAHPRIMFEQ